jgi:predicted dehydrogenase
MAAVHLITLAPGHFHAALVQKEMYPEVDPLVHVYAPLGPDLIAHLQRVAGFNSRKDRPTTWQLEIHADSDYLSRFRREHPGNVVILSGRNRDKIDLIESAVECGLHVLADKPWIIDARNLPRLDAVLTRAEQTGLIVLDIMTERHEITSMLQRELVNDHDVFGDIVPGDATQPGVEMASVHYLMKQVAGVPLRRPPWFFDIHQQGEGLSDVGTHLVDLVPWIMRPNQSLDWRTDLVIKSSRRWPTVLSRLDFHKVTGDADFPEFLGQHLEGDQLPYFCNTLVEYTLRGVHVKLDIRWDFEAAPGSLDTHFAVFRGSRSHVEVRQGAEQRFRPELYVLPARGQHDAVATAIRRRLEALRGNHPGLDVVHKGEQFHITIPDLYRVGHEAHFGEVTRQFLGYLNNPSSLPKWERPNMMAKYAVSTTR